MQFTTSMKEPHLFRRAYAKGKSAVTPTLVLYARKNGLGRSRLGLTTGAKIGKAVRRNRVRRRLREIYRLREPGLKPGYDLVVVARGRAVEASYRELERHFASLLKRLGLEA